MMPNVATDNGSIRSTKKVIRRVETFALESIWGSYSHYFQGLPRANVFLNRFVFSGSFSTLHHHQFVNLHWIYG
jgi:hypothetical protein